MAPTGRALPLPQNLRPYLSNDLFTRGFWNKAIPTLFVVMLVIVYVVVVVVDDDLMSSVILDSKKNAT
jgi:hypothetical protein